VLQNRGLRGVKSNPMAEKSTFGLDSKFAATINWDLAISRIISDIRSDFILAPHLSCVFSDSADILVADVKAALSSGKFSPQLPITIDIPKKQRIRVNGLKRQAPNFVRSGGILFPNDRLVYQVIADIAQPIIEKKLNRTICFSHQPADKEHLARMFKTSRECWTAMQSHLGSLIDTAEPALVFKADVASCFQSINQHTLVNNLSAAGLPSELVKPLESMLAQMSTSRSSRGILQGVFPSDLFGNFYLYPIDRYLADSAIPAVRYVDDLYMFFKNHDECDLHIINIFRELRKIDLYLNESKSSVMSPLGLRTSDPDLDAMFSEAAQEIEESLSEGDYEEIASDYGFQVIWHEPDELPDGITIEMAATCHLFNQIPKYPGTTEEIERFCLPLFAAFGSDYAVDHVLGKLEDTPSMAQIYFSYLSKFLSTEKVVARIFGAIEGRKLTFGWEYLWAIACVIRITRASDAVVAALLKLAKDSGDDSVRALALIAAAKHGDYDRQRTVVDACETYTSDHVRGAILFAARYMLKPLRRTTLDLLGHQGHLNQMIANSVKSYTQ
jgi:hypothetical protein